MTDAVTLPDVFLPYQQRLWQTIDANALSVHEKSRRTGFSWALGWIAAATAAAQRAAGGMDVLYMGYEREMTREFVGYAADAARAMQLAASEAEEFVFADPDRPEKGIGAFRIRFASGFEVVALPGVARALRGKQGLVILDEAAFMDDLAAVLKAALALLIWGGKVVVVSTHDGVENPFNTLANDIRAGRQRGAVTRTTFGEALAEGLYRRICLVAGRTWSQAAEDEWATNILATYRDNADEELHVIPNPTSGVVLPRVLVEARAVPGMKVARFAAPPGFATQAEHTRETAVRDFIRRDIRPALDRLDAREPHCVGMDFGMVRDLSVIWVLALGRDLVRRTRLVIELAQVPHEQQRTILFEVCDALPRFRAAKIDAGGNGSYIGQVALQRYGERVEPLQLTEPWYREHMPPLKAAVEDAMLTLPADRDVIDDLVLLKLVRGVIRVPDRRRTAAGETRHGDAAIAVALAYAASRADPELYEYEGAAPRGGRDWLGGAGAAAPAGGADRWLLPPDEDAPRLPGRGVMPDLRGAFR